MSSARERMVSGELYDASDPELVAARARTRGMLSRYNARPDRRLLEELFKSVGAEVVVEPPFHCDYGFNIAVGERFYANVNCVFLDCAPIEIGGHVLLGPGVQLYTATHPFDPAKRREGLEFAKPITIGDDAWLGGGAIVLPGVSIGDRVVVGAGSVVTRDIPADARIAGNPARPIDMRQASA
jgi:maltose O-acetyltransferase